MVLRQVVDDITGVLGDAYNFILAVGPALRPAEILPDGVLAFEKPAGKRFIDDGHVGTFLRVLVRDATPP